MSKVTRITFFAHSSILSGGGEGALVEMIHLLKGKAEICVILPSEGPLLDVLKAKNIKTEIITIPWWTSHNKDEHYRNRVLNTLNEIDKHFDEFKPDVCATNTSVIPWGAIAAKRRSIHHIWFVHEMLDDRSEIKYELSHENTASIIGDLSDLVVANSEYCLNELSRFIPKQKLLTVMPISHLSDIKDRATGQRPYQYKAIPFDATILLIVGRILDSKGQEDAVKALSVLNKKGIAPHLVLLGDVQEQYKNRLTDYASKHGVKKQLHILPFTLNPYPYIAHSDIVINSSRLESFGRSTVEAMVLGKPVIGADNSSTAQIITTNTNGILYKTGDHNNLAEKVHELLNDNELRETIVQGGQQTILDMEKTTQLSITNLKSFVRESTYVDHRTITILDYVINSLAYPLDKEIAVANEKTKTFRRYPSRVKHAIKRRLRRIV